MQPEDVFPADREVPLGDAFNQRILDRIRNENNFSLHSLFSRLRAHIQNSEWSFPSCAAVALVICLFAANQMTSGDKVRESFVSQVGHSFTPVPNLRIDHFVQGDLTIVSLQGLDPIPTNTLIAGNLHRSPSLSELPQPSLSTDHEASPILVAWSPANAFFRW